MNYSDTSKVIIASIAGLRIYDSPLQEKGDNRVFVGSLKLVEPIELPTGDVSAIRLQDWQVEQLVGDLNLISDEQLSRLLNSNRYGESSVAITIHERTVGETYKGSRKSSREFTIEPSSTLVSGEKVFSTEIEVGDMPLSLSEEAEAYLIELDKASDVALRSTIAKERVASFKQAKASRLERLAKRFPTNNSTDNTEKEEENNDAKTLMQEQLDLLLEVPSPTTVQKKEIKELKEKLAK